MPFRSDFEWQKQFIPTICGIVGPYLLVPSEFDMDAKAATDLIILNARDLRIACRMRKPGYLKFRDEFTVRAMRQSGAQTELDKILRGFGDWMFYGHAGEAGGIAAWSLIDLSAFRYHLGKMARGGNSSIRWGTKDNGDGTLFNWFAMESFPDDPPLLIARHSV